MRLSTAEVIQQPIGQAQKHTHCFALGNKVGGIYLVSVCNESPHEAVERRIRVLQSVHKGEDYWRNVILGRDADNFCTKADGIFKIRQRATFLCRAYQIAILRMN
jgi:hypothetical protein